MVLLRSSSFELSDRDLGYDESGVEGDVADAAELAADVAVRGLYDYLGDRAGLNGNEATDTAVLLRYDSGATSTDKRGRAQFEATLQRIYRDLGLNSLRYTTGPKSMTPGDVITPATAVFEEWGQVDIPGAPIDHVAFVLTERRAMRSNETNPSVVVELRRGPQ